MRTFILSISAMLLCFSGIAQQKSNIEIFSEDGDAFYLVLNGVRQNTAPETNVTVTDINEGNYSVKVIFKNTKLNDVNKNLPLEGGKLYRFKVKKNRKGKPVMRYFGEVALNEAPEPTNTVTYHETEITAVEQPAKESTSTSTRTGTDATSTTTTTTSTTSSSDRKTGADGGSVTMKVDVGGTSMDMDVSVSGDGSGTTATSGGTATSSTTTTTTTTTTSSSSDGFSSGGSGGSGSTSGMSSGSSSGMSSGSSTSCSAPTATSRVDDLIAAIEEESFADDKMRVAKQGSASMCLEVVDVIRIGELFSFEEDRLKWAKGAYSRTFDQENYYKVNTLFDFSDSKEELEDYINSH